MSIKQRNIATAIIFSFLTCGIYTIFWMISLTDEIGYLSKDNRISGGKAFLYMILTCGIYTLFWYYRMGQLIPEAQREAGLRAIDDKSILYLLLGIFGLGIVSICLMQSEVNNIVAE